MNVQLDGAGGVTLAATAAEVVDVAGAGHMVAGDRNDAFNDAVIRFVSRC